MAVSDISKDIIHMRSLLRSMGFAQLEATTVLEDNTACIDWGSSIIGGHVATTAQLADIMTKGVKLPQWEMCTKGLLGRPLIPAKPVVAQEGVDD